jgi:hypothetical protein
MALGDGSRAAGSNMDAAGAPGRSATGNHAVAVYAFQATDLPAGTHYVRACFSFGCGDYRTAAGAPVGTRVEGGRRVAITFAL